MMRLQTENADRRKLRDFVPAIILLFISSGGLFVTAQGPSGASGQYALLAPIWYSRSETIGLVDKAGGEIVDFGDLANIVIVHSDDPGFVRVLYRAGAWIVIDPTQRRGCIRAERNSVQIGGAV